MIAGEVTNDTILAVLDRVRQATGLSFTGSRLPHAVDTVRRELSADARETGEDRAGSGFEDRRRLDRLVEQLTVGETYFFRHREHFDFLAGTVLPGLRGRIRASAPVRCWSAGCSTGEEPYSLAIMLGEAGLDLPASILGSDISESSLRIAETGYYGKWSFRQCDDAFVERHFTQEGRRFRLDPTIRRRVRFERVNLVADRLEGSAELARLDVVFCRNVLIYFGPQTVVDVTRKLLGCLAPGGWLFVGPSDPRIRVSAPFELISMGHGTAYRRYAESGSPTLPVRRSMPSPVRPAPPAAVKASAPVRRVGASGVAPKPASGIAAVRAAAVPARPALAAEVAPSEPPPVSAAIAAALTRGDFAQAEVACREALRRDPLSLQHLLSHADALIGLGAWIDAAEALERALYVDPGSVAAHEGFAGVLDRLGETRLADRARRNARQLEDRRSGSSDTSRAAGHGRETAERR